MPSTAPAHISASPSVEGAAGSKTLDNGIRILSALARHPHGLTTTQLAHETALHRTGVYRLLGTLTRRGLVTQRADTRYQLGLTMIELAGAVRPDLRATAQVPLRDLAEAAAATAFLSVLDGDEVVSALVVEPLHADAHVAYRIGTRHPATVGSAGLAILSARAAVTGERAEITEARRRGYSISEGELQRGAWGLAAPVRPRTGEIEASVGVVALGALDEPRTAQLVVSTAAAIGNRLP
ncbi:helix-turn-helix domain-containing protein [Phytoactinopolyspora alkaliphila]|uniref:Helix-turn-helix domain-containing protein n=1 Tax=Phytoactinopolyspora alkaliphila TaxID=1783498 RepID=A0A6N9YIE1_9ACTN|nr:helix-turn-helix domain-containing protein [Phytoactinopolyspora alkaliphila]NED94668.1 helix-turn-helix domain-containing protein [Phytoactinopolyspora alkaliphila]